MMDTVLWSLKPRILCVSLADLFARLASAHLNNVEP